MENLIESTAVMLVTSRTDLEVLMMNKEQMRREKLYQITMSMVKKMLSDGLISKEEYAKIDIEMKEKYKPIFSTLFSDIDLI